MGILSILTGNSKAASKILDASISGIDKLVLTEEEKLDYRKDTQKMYLEFVKISASESTAQSVSRRLICLPVVYVWLILVVAHTVLSVIGVEGAESIAATVQTMNVPALAAIGFYVGRHMVTERK